MPENQEPPAPGLLAQRTALLRLLTACGPRRTAALLAAELVAALVPVADALVTGRLVGGVEAALRRGTVAPATAPLAAFAVLLIAGQLAHALLQAVTTDLGRLVDGRVRKRARDLVLRAGRLGELEDPAVQDDLARAADLGVRGSLTRSPGAAATAQAHLLFRIVGGLAAAAVLARYAPLLAVVLFAVALLMRALVRRHFLRMSDAADALVPAQRRADHWLALAGGPEAAKEIRLFGLARWVADRQRGHLNSWWERHRAEARRLRFQQWPVAVLGFAAVLAALALPGRAVLAGSLTLSQLATCLVAVWGVLDLTGIGNQPFQIEYGTTSLRALTRLEARLGPRAAAPAPEPAPAPDAAAAPTIRFEGVSFRYPGAPAPVLDGLDLEIRPGEVLGVVGDNGAGKTTLIKLLAGLYTPTAGRITVDGEDLAGLAARDGAAWRRRLAVLFQDFVRLPVTLADNVRLGAPEAPGADIGDALRAAGAADLAEAAPDGPDTLLWREGTGGHDLSGGQWQRLAFARVVHAARHGRRVVVLDEPTAHLDVVAESDFYGRAAAALPGATVVLITHRFATIRRADRIVLLRGGRIAESGSHDALTARQDSEYARLFRLQAARFEAPEGDSGDGPGGIASDPAPDPASGIAPDPAPIPAQDGPR